MTTAIDSSVAVPLLVEQHESHPRIARWADGRTLALAGHALIETYSILTRLPPGLRVTRANAVQALSRLSAAVVLSSDAARTAPETFAARGIDGGSSYDGLVALAALEHQLTLATRDRRAVPTYRSIGVQFVLLG